MKKIKKILIANRGEIALRIQRTSRKLNIAITYTNRAADEIKERLGNSELVKVSTIHERLWELIEPYQKQLVEIHKENIENELSKNTNELNENALFTERNHNNLVLY